MSAGRLINSGFQIFTGVIGIFPVQQVYYFQIGIMWHLVNNTLEHFCHCGYCHHQDWLNSRCKGRMRHTWSGLDLYDVAGYRIESPQWIALQFFTDNPSKVILGHIHPHFKGVRSQNPHQQPLHNFLSHQFAYHHQCYSGESLAKNHFFCHQ